MIKGPPGTGKSQTIANLITTLVARGRRVLFVAEKRAAIAAVLDRLTRRGLADLVMDVHDGTSARRRIAADLKTSLEAASRVALPDLSVLHETLADRRSRLSGHAEALHLRRDPFELSVFEAQTRLLALRSRFGQAAGSTSPPGTPPSRAGWCWPSRPTAPATTPPRPPGTATGSARNNWSGSAGGSTASGRPAGSPTHP